MQQTFGGIAMFTLALSRKHYSNASLVLPKKPLFCGRTNIEQDNRKWLRE